MRRGRAGRVEARGTRIGRAAALAALVLALAGCGRNQFVVTDCAEGRPVIERTLDVAPPNC